MFEYAVSLTYKILLHKCLLSKTTNCNMLLKYKQKQNVSINISYLVLAKLQDSVKHVNYLDCIIQL